VINTLAQKSNYQNILEGNHSSLGLNYPKELSSGIESRRTSHKVAEQARRSRINNAIDQLGTMLPGENDGISKAITVEKAIEYIKTLEDQLEKVKAELAAKK
jgi:flagellin-like hook-associated protein FlgL